MAVKLRCYDLSRGMAAQFSPMFLGQSIEAIWHTGIEVYGFEYFFSGGIQSERPQLVEQTLGMRPLRVIDLGTTSKSKSEFESFLRSIHPRFTVHSYNLFTNNCNHFSDEASRFLLGQGIPSDIVELPNQVLSTPLGQMLRGMQEHIGESFASHDPFSAMAQSPSGGPAPSSLAAEASQTDTSISNTHFFAEKGTPIIWTTIDNIDIFINAIVNCNYTEVILESMEDSNISGAPSALSKRLYALYEATNSTKPKDDSSKHLSTIKFLMALYNKQNNDGKLSSDAYVAVLIFLRNALNLSDAYTTMSNFMKDLITGFVNNTFSAANFGNSSEYEALHLIVMVAIACNFCATKQGASQFWENRILLHTILDNIGKVLKILPQESGIQQKDSFLLVRRNVSAWIHNLALHAPVMDTQGNNPDSSLSDIYMKTVDIIQMIVTNMAEDDPVVIFRLLLVTALMCNHHETPNVKFIDYLTTSGSVDTWDNLAQRWNSRDANPLRHSDLITGKHVWESIARDIVAVAEEIHVLLLEHSNHSGSRES